MQHNVRRYFSQKLGLHMQLIPLDLTVADRWFYFTMVGVLGLIGVIIQEFGLTAIKKKNTGVQVLILVILLGLFSF